MTARPLPPHIRILLEPYVRHRDGDDTTKSIQTINHLEDDWPKGASYARDEIYALGVLALNYSQLEGIFQAIFATVARLNENQVGPIFSRLPNNHRHDILMDIMQRTTISERIAASVVYFCDGFKICSESRHAVMHSRSGGFFVDNNSSTHGLVLLKTTKRGNEMICRVTLQTLREIADAISSFTLYGSLLVADINDYLFYRELGDGERAERYTSRDKPPVPSLLKWQLHTPTANKEHRNPSNPSQT